MKKLTILFFFAALALASPQRSWATGACTCARFNDWKALGCRMSPGSPGAPASGAKNAGGNQASCPTCPPDGGMSRWWVDEPYVNLHISDTPLKYSTSSGQEMDFRFLYKQRFMLPMPDQCPDYYNFRGASFNRDFNDPYILYQRVYGMTNATWGHNWMLDIAFWDSQWENLLPVQQNNTPVFSVGYEALVFRPEGGIYYFFTNINSATTLTDAESQNMLQPRSGLAYPVTTNHPTADANGIYWGDSGIGFKMSYPDGSQDVFGIAYYLFGATISGTPVDTNTTAHALLTQRIDPQGRITSLGYEYGPFPATGTPTYYAFRIKYVVDPDGRTNTFLYNPSIPLSRFQISEIDSPSGPKAQISYDGNGMLTGVTDAVGNTSSFTYSNYSGWMGSLTTLYGTTAFSYYQVPDPSVTNGFVQRATYVAEPGGAGQLFFYTHTNQYTAATATAPTVPNQSFDDGTPGTAHYSLVFRNTFHWDRRQFSALSTNVSGLLPTNLGGALGQLTGADYNKAALKHWLIDAGDQLTITDSLSSEQDPSPDAAGTITGLRTWYNYAGKPSRELSGNPQVDCVARLLPDGTSQYVVYNYSGFFPGLVTDNESTYTLASGSVGVRTNWFVYAGNGIDLLTTSNSAGQFAKFYYNPFHQATNVLDSLNETTVLAWDTNTHNLANVSLPSGQTVALAYYPTGTHTNTTALVQTLTIQPENRVISVVDYTNNLARVVHATGTALPDLWLTNTWDGLNRLTGTTFQDGSTISNVYTFLDLTAQKDRLGRWTYLGYDSLEHLTALTNALNFVTQFGWCGCGALTSITDALTNTVSVSYDNQGRLTGVNFPDSSSLSYQFDLAGRMTNVLDGSSRSVQLGYNNQGLVTSASNSYGALLQVTYDSVDRPSVITDANGITTTNTYDLINRILSRAWAAGGGESFVYATNGLIAYTNRDTLATLFGRDTAGRITSITNANQKVTQFGYDGLDHVTSLIDGLTHSTTWHYNQYGWLTNKVDALNREVLRFTYNPNGQLTNRWTLANGNTAYAFDAIGNLTNVSYAGATNATAPISFSFDAVGNLTNMVDASGTNTFTFTATGQLLSETGPWASDTVSYGYLQGHRTNLSLTQPSASAWSQTYGYDSEWRLISLSATSGLFQYGYGALTPASSLVKTLGLPNSATITNHYDSLARLDFTALQNQWGHVLDGQAYVHDSLGLTTNITRNLGLTTNSVSVGYDSIGQIISWAAKESSGTPRLNEQLGFAYDASDNLTFRTNGALVQTFTVDPVNELTNITRTGTLTLSGATPAPANSVTVNGSAAQVYGDFTFARTNLTLSSGNNSFTNVAQNAYGQNVTNTLTVNLPTSVNLSFDGSGNLTSDQTRTLIFNAEDQLTNINVAAQWKSEFTYDGFGRRRIQKDYNWQSGAWNKTNEIRFIYDGPLVIQERDSFNTPQVTYTRGIDLSGSLQGAGGIGGVLARTDGNGSTFYHADGSGNITALMDGNQNIVARYLYSPFGGLIGRWGTMATPNRVRFSSMSTDDKSGLVHFYGREFNPVVPGWISPDPIGEAGGINLYRFARNNPIRFIDPYGFDVLDDYVADQNNQNMQRQIVDAGMGNGYFDFDQQRLNNTLNQVNSINDFTGVNQIAQGIQQIDNGSVGSGAMDVLIGTTTLGTLITPEGEGKSVLDKVGNKIGKLWDKCKKGIYEFKGKTGKPYVGQSKQIQKRIGQHLKSGKLPPNELPNVKATEVTGDKTAREIAEQNRINELGGLPGTENQRNPIGPDRSHLLNQ